MYKLDKLSIADLKAIYDYSVKIVNDESPMSRGDEYDMWIDVALDSGKLLEARIKQLFKP